MPSNTGRGVCMSYRFMTQGMISRLWNMTSAVGTLVKRKAESGGPAMTDTTSSYSRRPEAALPFPLPFCCALPACAAGSAWPAAGAARAGANCSAEQAVKLRQGAVSQGGCQVGGLSGLLAASP
jgi:hypothetical protein